MSKQEYRYATSPEAFKNLTTEEIRRDYLIESLFQDDKITATYTAHDRMIILGARPIQHKLHLPTLEPLTKAEYFLQRRELGAINIGGPGTITTDGTTHSVDNLECLYIGKGVRSVQFSSEDPNHPSEFYINSCPAHAPYPTVLFKTDQANQVHLGALETANERTIYQFIHEKGIQSCQLVMGLTILKTGSVWNTFPPHTHHRRMEAYLYFNLPENNIVMHFMGDPAETRHIVVRNKQAIISPEWSIHSGAGTTNYTFIWGMAGENQAFTDMDPVNLTHLA